MAIEIANNTNTMGSDIQTLRSHLTQLRANLRELQYTMNAMNNMWKGPANQGMRQRFQNDYTTVTELCNFLDELIENLESARQAYENCEANVADTVASIQIF